MGERGVMKERKTFTIWTVEQSMPTECMNILEDVAALYPSS